MGWFNEYEKGCGTYLKVIRFPQPSNPDGFVVLYLRPSGRFLLAGYWAGYERTVAAGNWERQGAALHLKGRGRVEADFVPGPGGGRFERVFTVQDVHFTPYLTASDELRGWSLLSWTGPFAYVGQRTIIDPDGRWLPDSDAAVDAWIQAILGA